MKKKVLAVPMHHQYEQQCNALSLEKMGIPVIWKEADFSKKLKDWVNLEQIIMVDFPDETEEVVRKMIKKYR